MTTYKDTQRTHESDLPPSYDALEPYSDVPKDTKPPHTPTFQPPMMTAGPSYTPAPISGPTPRVYTYINPRTGEQVVSLLPPDHPEMICLQSGEHITKTDYGIFGILAAIIWFPLGIGLCLLDRRVRCERCGTVLENGTTPKDSCQPGYNLISRPLETSMTRITNFGRKRTYIASEFEHAETTDLGDVEPEASSSAQKLDDNSQSVDEQQNDIQTVGDSQEPPPKKRKKRIRTPKSKRDGYVTKEPAEGEAEMPTGELNGEIATTPAKAQESSKKKKKAKQKDRKERLKAASESRRLQRIKEKYASTTCFACRERGHAAKDCPKSVVESGLADSSAKAGVGICYRCGSQKHTLSKCRKPSDPSNLYPYATCFVCSATGHLASACPQNAERGIYPNGGSCKLCGQKTHLAKDCEVGKKVNDPTAIIIGSTTSQGGADEDDFHILKRATTELGQVEKQLQKDHGNAPIPQALDSQTNSFSHLGKTATLPVQSISVSKKPKVVNFR